MRTASRAIYPPFRPLSSDRGRSRARVVTGVGPADLSAPLSALDSRPTGGYNVTRTPHRNPWEV